MQLITTLLIAIAALTILTGVSILFGTTKQSRAQGAWFFIAALGAAVWSAAIAIFLTMPESSANLVQPLVVSIITGIALTDVAMLGYTSWPSGKSGKALTALFGLVGITIIIALALHPELFYSHVTFGYDHNTIHTTNTWYFYVLIAFFTLISLVYSGFLTKTIKRIKNRGAKNGLRIFQLGLSVGGILALVFDLLLLTSHSHLAWIGPMAVSISIITFYYSVVKYRILALTGKWLQILSYIILIAAGVIVYVLIFYTIFTSLFRVASPSAEILLLNFIMIAIVLCLMPALREISSLIKAQLPTKQIDIGYITRKLRSITRGNYDTKELASFLATQLKLDYFGFLIGGKLIGSSPSELSADELVKVSKLKHPARGIWLNVPDGTLDDSKYRVAELVSAKNTPFGHAIVGRSASGRILEPADLAEIEMVINLSALILDGGKGL